MKMAPRRDQSRGLESRLQALLAMYVIYHVPKLFFFVLCIDKHLKKVTAVFSKCFGYFLLLMKCIDIKINNIKKIINP